MGTKNDPGEFDCYDAADPDEPMFVLLARDWLASDLVFEWADRRETLAKVGGAIEPDEARKIGEARSCAQRMFEWKLIQSGQEPRLHAKAVPPTSLEEGSRPE